MEHVRTLTRILNMIDGLPTVGLMAMRASANPTIVLISRELREYLAIGDSISEDDDVLALLKHVASEERFDVFDKCQKARIEKRDIRMMCHILGGDGQYRTVFFKVGYLGDAGAEVMLYIVFDMEQIRRKNENDRITREGCLALAEMSTAYLFRYFIKTDVLSYVDGSRRHARISDMLTDPIGRLVSSGILPAQSGEELRSAIKDIDGKNPTRSVIVSANCENSDVPRWLRVDLNTVFDAGDAPLYAIASVSDVTSYHEAETAYKRKRQALIDIPLDDVLYYEANLSNDTLQEEYGNAVAHIAPHTDWRFEGAIRFAAQHLILPEDAEHFLAFLDRSRLISLCKQGVCDHNMSFRLQRQKNRPEWAKVNVNLIEDPHTGDICAFLTYRFIRDPMRNELELRVDVERMKNELSISRAKVMANRLKPYFQNNMLSMIRAVLLTNPDYAYDLLCDFSTYLRGSIRSMSSEVLIDFSQELKYIHAYVNLEYAHMGDAINIFYDLRETRFKVIPFAVLPYIENAIQHGVFQRGKHGGTVTLRTKRTEDAILITIEDDGVGFDAHSIYNESIQDNEKLLKMKSHLYRLKTLLDASVHIDSTLGVGTIVTVTIPQAKPNDQ